MRMSIKELTSVAEQRRAERHQRQKEDFEGVDLIVLEEILRIPSIDAGLRSDLTEWLVRAKREVKVDLEQKELHASSWERLALPVMVVVFGILNWVAQTIGFSSSILPILQMLVFGLCSALWWSVRSEALKTIKSVKKRQAVLGKVE